MPDLSPYGWSRDNQAICVAVVAGRTEDEVIDGYGGDPAAAVPARLETAGDVAELGDSVLLVTTVGDRVLAVEDNGFEGSRPEVLRELTGAGGTAASVFWNVNSVSRVGLAEAGELVVGFEGLFPGNRWGADPDRLVPLLRELGFRTEAADPDDLDPAIDPAIDHDWKARSLALLAALTGVRVTAELLAGPFRAVPLVPLPGDLPTGDDALVRYDEPEVAAALDATGPRELRAGAVAAARAALAVAGLDAEPLLVDALRRAAAGDTGEVDRRSELGRLLGRYAVEGQRASLGVALSRGDADEHRRAMWRHRAARAVRAALAPDPAVAAWQAASTGGVYLPAGAPVRTALLAALRP
jgi:hypothetical protein